MTDPLLTPFLDVGTPPPSSLVVLRSLAVADALGAATEFQRPEDIAARLPRVTGYHEGSPFGFAPGEATDDTQMTVATLLGYASGRGLTGVLNALRTWAGSDPPDVGTLTRAALRVGRVNGGVRAWEASGRTSAGNGGLMRVAAVFIAGMRGESLLHEAARVTALTHADPRCVLASVFLVAFLEALEARVPYAAAAEWALSCARTVDVPMALRDLLDEHDAQGYAALVPDAFASVESAVRGGLRGEAPSQSGFVLDTLRAAVARANGESWMDCVASVVLRGEDSDTVACVVGAILGARGLEAPAHLLPALRLGHDWPGWSRAWPCDAHFERVVRDAWQGAPFSRAPLVPSLDEDPAVVASALRRVWRAWAAGAWTCNVVHPEYAWPDGSTQDGAWLLSSPLLAHLAGWNTTEVRQWDVDVPWGFLVSFDGRFAARHEWQFPYSAMWSADNPFRGVHEVRVSDVRALHGVRWERRASFSHWLDAPTAGCDSSAPWPHGDRPDVNDAFRQAARTVGSERPVLSAGELTQALQDARVALRASPSRGGAGITDVRRRTLGSAQCTLRRAPHWQATERGAYVPLAASHWHFQAQPSHRAVRAAMTEGWWDERRADRLRFSSGEGAVDVRMLPHPRLLQRARRGGGWFVALLEGGLWLDTFEDPAALHGQLERYVDVPRLALLRSPARAAFDASTARLAASLMGASLAEVFRVQSAPSWRDAPPAEETVRNASALALAALAALLRAHEDGALGELLPPHDRRGDTYRAFALPFEAPSAPHVLVRFLADGGEIILARDATERFVVTTNEAILLDLLPDEDLPSGSVRTAASWSAALTLLDAYPWPLFTPSDVHPDVRTRLERAAAARGAALRTPWEER
ncbi:ADP-ribosylglycohydrolase family protein [Deinococcus yavapaiensis]|uniref:ADP-ribosylglycohydrolase n=1 Tax=Deinococcus yavapaiensis KR-236 TaxID=694435 RepID=A0A318SF63_9DEIO|nr:ADP-ribosylglycohydrolase family protein [Deinococcus yavapaiensis]PYE52019.1 ADP-ribosylglycohydrolase [Deinococcus yavapaiensis KR-236]